jgi:hypothetical protein
MEDSWRQGLQILPPHAFPLNSNNDDVFTAEKCPKSTRQREPGQQELQVTRKIQKCTEKRQGDPTGV